MAEVALDRGYNQIVAASAELIGQIDSAENAEQLGRLLYQSNERIDYTLDRESQSVRSAWDLTEGLADLATFAGQQKRGSGARYAIVPQLWARVRSNRFHRQPMPKQHAL
jgi:hypothetical protein